MQLVGQLLMQFNMLMFGIIWVSLIWMYWTEVRPVKIGRHHERQAARQATPI